MRLMDEINDLSRAERMASIESRLAGERANVDFSGSVAAYWVEVDSSGLGVCEYNGKKYKAIRQGGTSIFAGSLVTLTYANGVYFADW